LRLQLAAPTAILSDSLTPLGSFEIFPGGLGAAELVAVAAIHYLHLDGKYLHTAQAIAESMVHFMIHTAQAIAESTVHFMIG
jgi:hypothetical protein